MRTVVQTVSWIACAATLLPSVLFLIGYLKLDEVKLWMVFSTILWFAVTSLWMGRKHGRFAPARPYPPKRNVPLT
ncbi:MAG: hypothetical protein MUE50_17100 [Pirellulaceae bacterium]|jgi:hypothetical protein|nr:hypothetical protein [Pirellulaceae bacterium]